MPRYKVKCKNGCAPFWITRAKLEPWQKESLKKACCEKCRNMWKARVGVVKSGVWSGPISLEEQKELDSLLLRLRENKLWGLEKVPIMDQFRQKIAKEEEEIQKGIEAFQVPWLGKRSQAWLKAQYRVVVGKAILQMVEG